LANEVRAPSKFPNGNSRSSIECVKCAYQLAIADDYPFSHGTSLKFVTHLVISRKFIVKIRHNRYPQNYIINPLFLMRQRNERSRPVTAEVYPKLGTFRKQIAARRRHLLAPVEIEVGPLSVVPQNCTTFRHCAAPSSH